MYILIVDDHKNNRMILKLLLEDYVEDHNEPNFIIDEAGDGLDAVAMCEKQKYDIVFMDIMMPNMDGIQATKLIRKNNKKVMIIAVSAVKDSKSQKLILSNGAEDYISKPINSDIFNSRIANYITLIKAREHVTSSEYGINLFTDEIYKRHIKFLLLSEDALSELWEYYLLGSLEKCDDISDIIRTIFSIAEIQLKLNIQSNLYVEDSEEYKYFTVVNLTNIPKKIIELTLKKNNVENKYKLNDEKISFFLKKIVSTGEIQESMQQNEPVEIDYKSLELAVFDYIDSDDLTDLEEYANRLSSLMLIVGSGDVTEDELMEIYTYIEKLGAILSTYSEVFAIAKALESLALDINTYSENFIKNSEDLGPLCTAFSKDFVNWIEQSFHTGAPSVDFMNDTIVVNCQTISGMLKMDEVPVNASESDDIDDIFDF